MAAHRCVTIRRIALPFGNKKEMNDNAVSRLLDRVERLNDIGIALSRERDADRLLETILRGAKELTGADAGTLYTRGDDDRLVFATLRNDTLGIALSGTGGGSVPFEPIPLYDDEGRPNHNNVAAYAALEGQTVNIGDAYRAEGFDFSGTRAVDARTGYRSRSFLTVPLRNHEERVVGVLQLINAMDPRTREVVPFGESDRKLAESLASQAAVALTQKALIDAQRELFESFIELIAKAIDEKNPTTGKHCERVPQLTLMLADAARDATRGPLASFEMSDDEYYALKVGAWLHDCGKITTPEEVLNKSTKLEALRDRIHEVDLRFELVRRDHRIRGLKARLPETGARDSEEDDEFLERLDADRDFIRRANVGGEFMAEDDQERVARIGRRYRWCDAEGVERPLLSDEEIEKLQIARGTLSAEERESIQNHVKVTLEMLDTLPYPANLRDVPEIAGSHHERMDGTGYPRGLTREQMSVPARMVAVADVFEALTAADRPYKKAKTLSESLRIMGLMSRDDHIDPDLFDCFVREGVYLRYAEQFLRPEQIDHVDLAALPGYEP